MKTDPIPQLGPTRYFHLLAGILAVGALSATAFAAMKPKAHHPGTGHMSGSYQRNGGFFLKPSYNTYWSGNNSRTSYQPTYRSTGNYQARQSYGTGRNVRSKPHYGHGYYYPNNYNQTYTYAYAYANPAPAYGYPPPATDLSPEPAPSYQERTHFNPGAARYSPQNSIRRALGNVTAADLGWSFLARGAYQAALTKFAEAASQEPDSGLRLIGYGLASGLNGNHGTSLAAFRRAFHVDPKGATYLPGFSQILHRVKSLAKFYELNAEKSPDNPDHFFMLGALLYFLGQHAEAEESLVKATAAGDRTESSRNLKDVLEEYAEIGGKNSNDD